MQHARIAFWGDSIGRGIDFDSQRSRYAVIRDNFAALLGARGFLVDNRSRFGATVTDGFADFTASGPLACEYVMLEYGGNDCNMPWDKVAAMPDASHEAATPLPLFESTLKHFVQAILALGKKPLLMTPPPLMAERFTPWVSQGLDASAILRYIGDLQHVYRWHERYANAVRRVAQEYGCPILDVRDMLLGKKNYPELVGVDGMHINPLGHEVIADYLESELPKVLQ